jgi:hypothetical protein
MCVNRSSKRASRGSASHFVCRHSEKLEHGKVYPQEDAPIRTANEIARIYVANLTDHAQDVPTELIFNMDEVGSQDWTDRKARSVMILHQNQP